MSTDSAEHPISDNIEVVPVVVVSQAFPARPSSIPEIRDFVRGCLAQSPLSAEDTREVGETVSAALLDAAGPTGAISVSFRIFPDHVEVDVLRSGPQGETPPGVDAMTALLRDRPPAVSPPPPAGSSAPADPSAGSSAGAAGGSSADPSAGSSAAPEPAAGAEGESRSGPGAESRSGPGSDDDDDDVTRSFAAWMSGVLHREGMSIESAARQLGVSVKTVSRWVGGSTEPRLRDLRRIHDLFGEVPFP